MDAAAEVAQLEALSASLKSTASKYAQVSNELVATLSFLGYIASSLQTSWKGSSTQAFMDAWDRAIRDGAYLSEALSHASVAMRTLASAIDTNAGSLIVHNEHNVGLNTEAMQAANDARDVIAAAASAANSTLNGLIPTVGVCSNGKGPLPSKWTTLPGGIRTKALPDGTTVVIVYIEGVGLRRFNLPPGSIPPGGSGNQAPDCGPSGWNKALWFFLALMGGAMANTTNATLSWLSGQEKTNALESQFASNVIGSLIAGGATLNLLKKYSSLCSNNVYALALAQAFIGGAVGGVLSHYVIQPYLLNPIFGDRTPKPKPKAQPQSGSNPNPYMA